MKMTVTFDNGKTVDLPTKSKTVDLINSKYPEMGMMIGKILQDLMVQQIYLNKTLMAMVFLIMRICG